MESTMTKKTNEGLADLAHKAEKDHEVQMARAELYKVAKYAIKLHEMLQGVSEQEGLEGWVASKITKSADYIGSVYHHMDYQISGLGEEEVAEGKSPHKKGSKKYKKHMAAKHASMGENTDPYKSKLHAKLAEKKDSAGIDAMKKAGNAKADAEAKEKFDESGCVKEMKKLYASGCAKNEMYKKLADGYGCSKSKFEKLYASNCG